MGIIYSTKCLGCGIHTGETLVGNVGTDNRDYFTALGPHVNFAQRIESRASKGQILISARTKARISDHFTANANTHLQIIHDYITRDSKTYATRFIKSLIKATLKLKMMPYCLWLHCSRT